MHSFQQRLSPSHPFLYYLRAASQSLPVKCTSVHNAHCHIPAGALKEGQLEVVSQLSEQYCSHTSRTIFISKFILLCYFLLRFWTVIAEGRLAFLCYTHKTSEGVGISSGDKWQHFARVSGSLLSTEGQQLA